MEEPYLLLDTSLKAEKEEEKYLDVSQSPDSVSHWLNPARIQLTQEAWERSPGEQPFHTAEPSRRRTREAASDNRPGIRTAAKSAFQKKNNYLSKEMYFPPESLSLPL